MRKLRQNNPVGSEAPRALGETEGSECAGVAETFSGRSAAAAATRLPQATGGARAGEPEQPEVTRGLWLTDALEHMADTPLGTSRLGRRGTLQGDSFIYLKHIYLFIYLSTYLLFARHCWRYWSYRRKWK